MFGALWGWSIVIFGGVCVWRGLISMRDICLLLSLVAAL